MDGSIGFARDVDTAEIIAALEQDFDEVPLGAVRTAAAHWARVKPALLARVTALPADRLSDHRADLNLTDTTMLLAAQVRDADFFGPLCALARRPDVNDVMGGELTEALSGMLVRTFGNTGTLRELIEDEAANEFARGEGLQALAWLTATGVLPRTETEAYLTRLLTELQPREMHWGWYSLTGAIAVLGLADLRAQAEQIYAEGLVGSYLAEVKHFHEDLAFALKIGFGPAAFGRYGPAMVHDAAAHIQKWRRTTAPRPTASVPIVTEKTGRNAPCPCGSGVKYKKCCLP